MGCSRVVSGGAEQGALELSRSLQMHDGLHNRGSLYAWKAYQCYITDRESQQLKVHTLWWYYSIQSQDSRLIRIAQCGTPILAIPATAEAYEPVTSCTLGHTWNIHPR